jgi:hypothetical protein
MTNRNVLGLLFAPDRESSLRAVSLSLLKVRGLDGMTCEKLGKALECSADTIRNASNEDAMLCFTSIARLLFLFPDESAPIRQLFDGEGAVPTADERIARIERDLEAIRKELSA